MITLQRRSTIHAIFLAVAAVFLMLGNVPRPAFAEVTAIKQAIAEAAAQDSDIAAYYRTNGYSTIWTGRSDIELERRAQLLRYLDDAEAHGLPVARYDSARLKERMQSARNPRELGSLEVELTRVFLQFSRDLQTGVLVPGRVDGQIEREVPYRDRSSYLVEFTETSPSTFFRALPPQTAEYAALMKEKLRLEGLLRRGGWGPQVPGTKMDIGDTGNSVAMLRNRLIAMGYLGRTNSQIYDAEMKEAIQRFQLAHGLEADGVAGKGTLDQINVQADRRLQSVIVAMERERWMNRDRGERHVFVNIPDFTAKIVDHGKVTFETRAVVGAATSDRTTPEFSDVMEFMVVNPSWYVPRSIVTKEYLPMLRQNPNAVSHIEITDRSGRRVNRGAVNFAQYSAGNFPFAMRQPPSRSNALGLVKFMFPNPHNIYLHDTPAKSLFARESRAYSHGCIRLADPFDFAYALLARQTDDPKGKFQSVLSTGRETRVEIEKPIPVHIDYRTAFSDNKGRMQYRRDVYGRDGRIWNALANAGVALNSFQG